MWISIKAFAEYPASTAAVTYWAPSVAKWSGSSEEEIRAVLERVDGVTY
jgi:hypothetical protein